MMYRQNLQPLSNGSSHIMKTMIYIISFYCCLFIYSINAQSIPYPVKHIKIEFEKTPGAQYYEILFMENIDEDFNTNNLITVKKASVKKVINAKFNYFQIRAVFSNTIKTNWSKIYTFKLSDIIIDHSTLKISNNPIYRTQLKVQAPYFHRNSKLWVGANSTFLFTNSKYVYLPNLEVFYRFRLDEEVGEQYTAFKKPFKIKSLFKNVESHYKIEFYAVVNKQIREKLNQLTIFIDTKGPTISLIEEGDFYIWKVRDESSPIQTTLYIDDQLYKKYYRSSFYINKKEIPDIKAVTIKATDYWDNRSTWNIETSPYL